MYHIRNTSPSHDTTVMNLPGLVGMYMAEDQGKQLAVSRKTAAQFIMKGVSLPAPTIHQKTSKNHKEQISK